MSSLRTQLFELAANRVQPILDGLDEQGKVWLDGKWGIMNQDVILPLTVLAMVPHADNPCYGRAELVDAAHRIAQGTFDLQDELGRVEFVKPDGSRWGWIHMPWLFYGMLETYALLASDVPELRKQFWKGRLMLVYSQVRDHLAGVTDTHNITAWHAMALVLGGKLLGRPDWYKVGEQVARRTAAAQTDGGWWVEGSGPTTLYNLVYTHALGVYQRVSEDPGVLPALRRAGSFHRLMQYPDGSLVSLVDGRVRHHPRRTAFGVPGLALSPDGRGYLGILEQGRLPFACEGNGYTALGSALLHLEDQPLPVERAAGDLADGQARIALRGDWTVAGSAFTGETTASNRWWQDRAQHLEVHHAGLGLVIGGGNSKGDPALCQARFKVGHEEGGYYATSAKLVDDAEALLAVRTSYPRGDVLWRVLAECDGLAVEASAEGEGTCTVSLQLWANPGDALAIGEERLVLGAEPVARHTGTFTLGGVAFEGPAHGVLAWPLVPFNPYTADGSAELEEAVATYSYAVPPGATERVMLRVPSVRSPLPPGEG
ncbi:MAG: hypothetical protein HYU66_02225 [Armatimonadetes bacterium]|nr:hypothetical protein [Armatimonadota bacterium]